MLVKFRLIDGDYIYINPLHVVAVGPNLDGETFIGVVGDKGVFMVQGTVDEVARKINTARNI